METEEKMIQNLLDAIHKIVHADGPYKDKVVQILAEANDQDRSNLEEFCTWFDEVEW